MLAIKEDQLPSIGRRIWAKLIDYIGLSLAVYGATRVSNSYLVGAIFGYLWFLSTDWFGGFGKSFLKMKTINSETGLGCSFKESFTRNIALIVPVFSIRLHQGLLGLSRQNYVKQYLVLVVLSSILAIVWWLIEIKTMQKNSTKQRKSDIWAKTIVIMKTKTLDVRKDKEAGNEILYEFNKN